MFNCHLACSTDYGLYFAAGIFCAAGSAATSTGMVVQCQHIASMRSSKHSPRSDSWSMSGCGTTEALEQREPVSSPAGLDGEEVELSLPQRPLSPGMS